VVLTPRKCVGTSFENGYEVATYASSEHLLDRLPDDRVLGCILLDERISGLSVPQLQGRLSELGSTMPIIFLTGEPDIQLTVRAIKTGAEDFLIKPIASDVLLAAIERAIARHDVSRKVQSELNPLRALVATLSPRERQVYDLVVRGKMNKRIAFELGTKERTIKAHRQRVMEKLGARSLPELVLIAERLGHSSE